jgi:lipoprotein-anchoring transpeptidase ErfK/SrfK
MKSYLALSLSLPLLTLSLPAQAARSACLEKDCAVYAQVDIARQRITIWEDGRQVRLPNEKISSGRTGRGFRFSGNPDGRIYDRYTSNNVITRDYKGMGSMPYAVFLKGGFAISGTNPNQPHRKLGKPTSTGSILLHPDSARIFNRLVRKYGARNTWVTID